MKKKELIEKLKEVTGQILTQSHKELMAKTQEQLEDYWHFDFNKGSEDLDWYCYKFFKSLELYKSFCRRWEEEKNGFVCVVERVREKYLLPKIRIFLKRLQGGNGIPPKPKGSGILPKII